MEHLRRRLDALAAGLEEQPAPTKVVLVGLDVVGPGAADGAKLSVAQPHIESLRDAARDRLPNCEQIGSGPVEFMRPERRCVGNVDEIDIDGQSATGFLHDARDHRVDAEAVAGLLWSQFAILESRGRGTWSDLEPVQTREVGADFFGDALAQVSLISLGALIAKRQYCDSIRRAGIGRFVVRRRRRSVHRRVRVADRGRRPVGACRNDTPTTSASCGRSPCHRSGARSGAASPGFGDAAIGS